MTITTENYTTAFADLVAEAVSLTQKACQVTVKGEEGKSHAALLDELRGAYATRIKPVSARDYGRHEVLEKALGQYYGALVSHLSAICAKWQQIQHDSKNPLIDLEDESLLCCNEALSRALQFSDAAYAYVANLVRAHNELLSRAQLFTRQLDHYARKNKIIYLGDGGRDVLGYGAGVLSLGKIHCSFSYWDNVDCITPDLSALFKTPQQRAEVLRLAGLCFGDKAELGADLSTIELVAPVALVKIKT